MFVRARGPRRGVKLPKANASVSSFRPSDPMLRRFALCRRGHSTAGTGPRAQRWSGSASDIRRLCLATIHTAITRTAEPNIGYIQSFVCEPGEHVYVLPV